MENEVILLLEDMSHRATLRFIREANTTILLDITVDGGDTGYYSLTDAERIALIRALGGALVEEGR